MALKSPSFPEQRSDMRRSAQFCEISACPLARPPLRRPRPILSAPIQRRARVPAIVTAGLLTAPMRWVGKSLLDRSIRLLGFLAALGQLPKSAVDALRLMSTIAEASAIYREVAHPNYGYMFDTFHANIEEKDPPATYERYHREINHFHVSENDRGIPGTGHVPFQAHFDALRRCSYDGWLTVESFSRALPELAGATRVWRDLFDDVDVLFARSAAFVRQQWDAAGERLALSRKEEAQ